MARISTYPVDAEVKGGDILVGTDVNSLRAGGTKNFTVDSLGEYIKGKVAVTGQMVYRYTQEVEGSLGTFSLPGGGLNFKSFSGITSLVIAAQDRTPQNIVKFMEYLIGSDIYIGKKGEISTFGHYKVTAYTLKNTNTNFYELTLSFLGGNGSMELEEIYEIISFVKAGTGGDLHFSFSKSSASTVWNITHNLDKYPAVSIVDDNNHEVFAQVDYLDKNNLNIKFASAQSGKAYIN
jgi:hypothetical protein